MSQKSPKLRKLFFRLSWIRCSPYSINKTGIINFKRFLWEKYLQIDSNEFYPDVTLCQGPNEPGSIVKNDTALIFLSVLQSMERDNSTHNHRFLRAQTQKIGKLQVVGFDKDICDQYGKPFISSSQNKLW